MNRFIKKSEDSFSTEEPKKFSFNLKEMDRGTAIRIGIGLATALLVVGIYQFAVVPHVRATTREETIAQVDVNAMPKTTSAFIKPGAKISKYTLLTDEIVKKNIIVKQVPLDFAVEAPVPDQSLLIGKVLTVDMVSNGQVSLNQLTDQADWFGKFDRLKEYPITNTVAGQAQIGNLVDVVVDYGNGDYDVVLSKKKITNIRPLGAGTQQVQTNPNGEQAVVLGSTNEMVFSVDEKEYANLELAKKSGDLAIRLYIDEDQTPSDVTFNAGTAKIKAQQAQQKKNSASLGTGN
jgi:hypothetical protein